MGKAFQISIWVKKILTILFLIILTNTFGQDIKSIDKELSIAFGKIDYWANLKPGNIAYYDYLQIANDYFDSLLLKYTSSNPETITYTFNSLQDKYMAIATSVDGLFRIYSWDTKTGGTMHIFRNIFQYKSGAKIFSRKVNPEDKLDGDPGYYYSSINEIVSEKKKYYITESTSVLRIGLTYNKVKIFSIENTKLNDTAKLIKTKDGIKNELAFEMDKDSPENRDRYVIDIGSGYDKAKKIISIPLILENSEITFKKIKYQFTGKYFEKL